MACMSDRPGDLIMLSPALMPSLPAMPLPPMLVRGMLDNPAPTRVEERLPFSVRVVSDAEALDKAVQIRHAAYARHVPDLARNLLQAEQADFSAGAVVLQDEGRTSTRMTRNGNNVRLRLTFMGEPLRQKKD